LVSVTLPFISPVDILVKSHRVPSLVMVSSVNIDRGNLVVEPEFVNEVSNVTSNPAVLPTVVDMLIYIAN